MGGGGGGTHSGKGYRASGRLWLLQCTMAEKKLLVSCAIADLGICSEGYRSSFDMYLDHIINPTKLNALINH